MTESVNRRKCHTKGTIAGGEACKVGFFLNREILIENKIHTRRKSNYGNDYENDAAEH